MDKMYEEGGLSTDGADVDPISGNEVPPGSNAEEVRDDVDAKLSEGEYVVPADVVRYFGVGYFEKLRKKAKEALVEMDQDGRMGGEPVTAEEDLSPEEMAELESVLNMNAGGYVKQYSEGGLETGDAQQAFLAGATAPTTDWMQYSTPGSYVAAQQAKAAGATPAAQQQPAATASFVEYIGPNGQIMMVPVDAEGNPTIAVPEGYKVKGAVSAQRPDDDSGFDYTTHRKAQEEAAKRDNDWFDKFHAADDPLSMAKALLEDAPGGKIPGMLGSVIGGADTLSDIGRIRGYAAAIEKSNPDLAASLLGAVDEKIKGSGFGIKALESILGSGKQYADMYSTRMSEVTPVTPATAATTTSRYSTPTADQKTAFKAAEEKATKIAASQKDDGDSTQSAIDRHKEIFEKAKASGASAGVAGSAAAKTVTKGLSTKEKEGGAELDKSYGISGLAKGGLVSRPNKKAAAPKPKKTNKTKKGLGRK